MAVGVLQCVCTEVGGFEVEWYISEKMAASSPPFFRVPGRRARVLA